MLPHMGQGANQAIEDAMALAILLRGVAAADTPAALLRYQAMRRDHTARVQQSARENGLRFDSAQPLSLNHSWVRDYDVEKEASRFLEEGSSQVPSVFRSVGCSASDATMRPTPARWVRIPIASHPSSS
jgi:salicylate hydroxylase